MDYSDWHPILLLSAIGKTMEAIVGLVASHMAEVAEGNNFLPRWGTGKTYLGIILI